MSTLATLRDCLHHAARASSARDQLLAFLLAGFGVLGAHRQGLRRRYFCWINRFAKNGVVRFNLRLHGTPTTVELREANKADYLVACEFVRGGYERPDCAPGAIVDAGANIGLFALHAARLFPHVPLSCYEPDPANFVVLERNLALNRIPAALHRRGVWSRQCTLYYHAQDSHTGFVDENPPGLEIPCEVPEISADTWLKIDAEGAEYEVLPALLSRGERPKWISMEIHDFNRRGSVLLTALRENGYRVSGGEDLSVECTVISARHV